MKFDNKPLNKLPAKPKQTSPLKKIAKTLSKGSDIEKREVLINILLDGLSKYTQLNRIPDKVYMQLFRTLSDISLNNNTPEVIKDTLDEVLAKVMEENK